MKALHFCNRLSAIKLYDGVRLKNRDHNEESLEESRQENRQQDNRWAGRLSRTLEATSAPVAKTPEINNVIDLKIPRKSTCHWRIQIRWEMVTVPSENIMSQVHWPPLIQFSIKKLSMSKSYGHSRGLNLKQKHTPLRLLLGTPANSPDSDVWRSIDFQGHCVFG